MALAQSASALAVNVNAAWITQTGQTIDPDYLDAITTIGFEQLSAADQDALAKGVADIATKVASQVDTYATASTPDEAKWSAQLAVVATQLIRNLKSRQTNPPIYLYQETGALLASNGINVTSDPAHVLDATKADDWRSIFIERNSRELALADNVGWGEARYGRVMNFAHYGHLTRVPQSVVDVMGVIVQDLGTVDEGNVLGERYGDDDLLVAATTLEYKDAAGVLIPDYALSKFPTAVENDFADAATKKLLVLDMATAPPPVVGSLGKRMMRWQYDVQEVDLTANFNYMIVFDAAGPDTP